MPGWEIYLGTRVVVEFLSEKHPPRVPGPCTGEEVRAKHSKLPRRNAVNNTAQHRIGEKIPNFMDNTQNDMLKKRQWLSLAQYCGSVNMPCCVHRIATPKSSIAEVKTDYTDHALYIESIGSHRMVPFPPISSSHSNSGCITGSSGTFARRGSRRCEEVVDQKQAQREVDWATRSINSIKQKQEGCDDGVNTSAKSTDHVDK